MMATAFARAISIPVLVASAISLAVPAAAQEVRIFEPVQLAKGVSLTTFGIVEDSRCKGAGLCSEANRLVVAAVVTDGTRQREISLELGVPYQTASGTILLAQTSTPPRYNGAIRLSEYSLVIRFFERQGSQ